MPKLSWRDCYLVRKEYIYIYIYIEKILLVNKILEEKLEDSDYVLFLKPDDWLIPNTYLEEKLEDSDYVMFLKPDDDWLIPNTYTLKQIIITMTNYILPS